MYSVPIVSDWPFGVGYSSNVGESVSWMGIVCTSASLVSLDFGGGRDGEVFEDRSDGEVFVDRRSHALVVIF